MKKTKKRVSVTADMDKSGWIRDTWHPQNDRGFWVPYDDYYHYPLIPPAHSPEDADVIMSIIEDQQRHNLIKLIRREAELAAKAEFRAVHRKEKKDRPIC